MEMETLKSPRSFWRPTRERLLFSSDSNSDIDSSCIGNDIYLVFFFSSLWVTTTNLGRMAN